MRRYALYRVPVLVIISLKRYWFLSQWSSSAHNGNGSQPSPELLKDKKGGKLPERINIMSNRLVARRELEVLRLTWMQQISSWIKKDYGATVMCKESAWRFELKHQFVSDEQMPVNNRKQNSVAPLTCRATSGRLGGRRQFPCRQGDERADVSLMAPSSQRLIRKDYLVRNGKTDYFVNSRRHMNQNNESYLLNVPLSGLDVTKYSELGPEHITTMFF